MKATDSTAYIFDKQINIEHALKMGCLVEVQAEPLSDKAFAHVLQCLSKTLEIDLSAFDKHVQYFKNSIKEAVKAQLILIHQRLMGKYDAQLGRLSTSNVLAMQLKIKEDIHACTEGFLNRLNTITMPFTLPKSVDDLLFKVRMDLVEKAAMSILGVNENHAHNRVYAIAMADGLGVRPISSHDPYVGDIKVDAIRSALKVVFWDYYRAHHLPFLLKEQLHTIFAMYGYEGEKQQGYECGVYLKILSYLNDLALSADKLDIHRVFKVSTHNDIVDIHWEYINALLMKALQSHQIIHSDSTPQNINDWALYYAAHPAELIDPNVQKKIMEAELSFYESGEYDDLLGQLARIKKYSLRYYECLKTLITEVEPDRITALLGRADQINDGERLAVYADLGLFFQEMMERFFSRNDELKLVEMARDKPEVTPSLLTLIQAHAAEIGWPAIRKTLLAVDFSGRSLLMLALKHTPDRCADFLNFLKNNLSSLGQDVMDAMFFQSGSFGQNALLTSAIKSPDSLAVLLAILEENAEKFGWGLIGILLQKRHTTNVNILTAAVRRQPESVHLILKFLTDHREKLGLEVMKACLQYDKSSPFSGLMLAALFSVEALKHFLFFFESQADEMGWHEIGRCLQKQSEKKSLLVLSMSNGIDAVDALLSFLASHEKEMGQRFILFYLRQLGGFGENILTVASQFSVPILLRILSLVIENEDQLGWETVKYMLAKSRFFETVVRKDLQQLPTLLSTLSRLADKIGVRKVKPFIFFPNDVTQKEDEKGRQILTDFLPHHANVDFAVAVAKKAKRWLPKNTVTMRLQQRMSPNQARVSDCELSFFTQLLGAKKVHQCQIAAQAQMTPRN